MQSINMPYFLNPVFSIFSFDLTLSLLVVTFVGPKLYDTPMVFLKEFLKKLILKKKSAGDNKIHVCCC